MNDLYSYSDDIKRKSYYYYLILGIAVLISITIYVFLSFQPSVYKSSGKFAVFYSNNTESLTGGLQTNSDLTKSISETVKSRYFLEKISQSSNVKFDSKDLDNNIDNIIKTNVVTNSNIMTIEIYDKDVNDLNKINNVFLDQLNASKIITSSNSLITIQTIDPLYTSPNPTFPKPLTYALVAFVVVVVAGLLIVYSLTP